MLDQELIKRNFVGKDGFTWWIGQVASEEKWNPNMTGTRVLSADEIPGFGDRYKVRIMGYHTDNSTELTDDDLPWASVMLPVTAGGGPGASSQSPQIRQGIFVFGFFLDGEDAQQPMIMGIIGFNNYTVVNKGVPQIKYQPFEGFKQTDIVPQGTIREAPGSSSKTSTPNSVPQGSYTPPSQTQATVISGSSAHQIKSVAEKVQQEEGTKKSPVMQTDLCGSPIDAALLDVQEGLKEIQRIKAQVNVWAGVAIGRVIDQQQRIQDVTDRIIKNITKPLKDKIEETKKNLIKQVEDRAKDAYYLLFPKDRYELKVAKSESLEIVSCLFNRIVKGLLEIVSKTLLSFINKVVNVGNCIIENVIGGIIGQIGGLINGLIGLALGPMNAILGAVGSIIDLGDSILGFLFDALGFFRCEENPKCPGYKEWSIWNGTTVNEINKIGSSITNILQKAEDVKSTVQGAVSSVGSVLGGVDSALSSFNPAGFISGALTSCLSEILPVQCGPPTVSIFGGGGTGASGNPIIGQNGEILGIDIVDRGIGYATKPIVSIQDPCGNGQGSVVRVKLKKRRKGNEYGVSVGGTTGIAYGTNVSGVDNYQINEDPIQRNSYGIVPGEWSNIGIKTDISTPFDTFDEYRIPALKLEMSPPGGIVSSGDPVTLRYYTQNAKRIIYSNFNARSLGRDLPEEDLKNPKKIKVSEITFQEVFTPKTFILTVANDYGKVTAVLRVDIKQKDSDGEIVDKQIDEFIVEDPGTGYLSRPDGSLGGMGRIWSQKNQTVVKRNDGTYDSPYSPGDNIVLFPGDTIRTPINTSAIKKYKKLNPSFVETGGNIETFINPFINLDDEYIDIPGNIDYVVEIPDSEEFDFQISLPAPKIDFEIIPGIPGTSLNFNTNSDVFGSSPDGNPYPIILELYDVEILNGGINYSDNDQFVIDPKSNGVILRPILGAFGTVVDVEVVSTGKGFTTFPNIFINSETGFNARFVPKFRVNRIGDITNIDDLGIDPNEIISVIDCVGRVT